MRTPIEGCLLGCALGDAFGAPYEGGPLERATWAVLGRTLRGKRRFSDDTQMTLDLAQSLARCGRLDQDDLARAFAAGYAWHRGYGPGAAKLLKAIAKGVPWQQASRSVYPEGSFGNGAAMRAPLLGLLFDVGNRSDSAPQTLESAVVAASEITHAHPLGIDGARVIAAIARAAAREVAPNQWLRVAREAAITSEFQQALDTAGAIDDAPNAELAPALRRLGNGVAAVSSVPTAVCVARHGALHGFEAMMRLARTVGGDVDSIAAMAGAICGIFAPDALPADWIERVERVDQLIAAAAALEAFSP